MRICPDGSYHWHFNDIKELFHGNRFGEIARAVDVVIVSLSDREKLKKVTARACYDSEMQVVVLRKVVEFVDALETPVRADVYHLIEMLEQYSIYAILRSMKFRKDNSGQQYIGFASMKRAAMRNGKFRKEYEALQPKYDLIRAVLDARVNKGISQSELARRVGTTQSAIARFESGAGNPTLDFLSRVSAAIGARLEIRASR